MLRAMAPRQTVALLQLLTLLPTSCSFLLPQRSPSRSLRLNVAAEAPTTTTTTTTTTAFDGTLLSEVRGDLAVVAEEAQLAAMDGGMSSDELIAKTKDFIEQSYGSKNPDCLAESFQFIGPFVGPLNRTQYCAALEGALNPKDGFPDLIGRQYGFTLDPLEAGRVWWFTRPTGTFSGEFFGAKGDGSQVLETPPQCMGVVVDAEGKVEKFNMGTPVDRTSGNTGGMGGLFAYLHFVGKPLPIPECRPYRRSWQFALLDKVGSLLSKLAKKKEEKKDG